MLGKDKRSGRALAPGMGRVMRARGRWSDGFCHVDELDLISEKRGLFGANVYLRVPQGGSDIGRESTQKQVFTEPPAGGIEIFPVSVSSRWDFYRNAYTLSNLLSQNEEGQHRLRAVLPKPVYVAPEAGDLLILCSQRPHAVVGFDTGERVSVQTFLSHTKGEAIRMDC